MWHSRDHRWTETTLNAVATPILVADADSRLVLFVNREAIGLVGPHAVGSTVAHTFGLHSGLSITEPSGHSISREDNPVSRAARGENVGPVELLWHGRGETVALVCFAEQIPPIAGEPAAVVVSLFNVTAMKKLRDELARAETARDEFVHLAAHELRTPLTSLRLQVELARRKHSDLPGILAVSHAVDRMSKRIEQLIEVADMREHVVTLHPARVDLREIVGDAARLLEAQASWAHCPLYIAQVPPILGSWDKPRLTQVVASLLSNAVKFGAGKPVEIVLRDDGNDASVSVIDHGIGIKESERELIFARFQRRVSAAHFGGLGLDLWITRELLRHMRGTIEVGDTPNGGATMTIRVPKT